MVRHNHAGAGQFDACTPGAEGAERDGDEPLSRATGAWDPPTVDLLDLQDTTVTFDGMHLNPGGNGKVADALVEPILKAVAGAGLQR